MLVIMNPPYSGNLFLKITEKVLEANPAQVIMLGPVRWLQDPLRTLKKGSDFQKFGKIVNGLSDVRIIPKDEMQEIFNAKFAGDGGIHYITREGGFSVGKISNPILEKVIAKNTLYLKDYKENDKNSGWRVRISILKTTSNKGLENQVDSRFYLTHKSLSWVYNNGKTKDGLWWYLNKLGFGGSTIYDCNSLIPYSIPFAKEQEALNFEKSTKTNFYRYVFGNFKLDQNVPLNYLPYMGDYTKKWDDKRFYEYFNITEDEQKEIYNFLKKNNVPNLFGEESEGVLCDFRKARCFS